jgi:primosomal protein N' (replication factor Y) (superfamily II helicase)
MNYERFDHDIQGIKKSIFLVNMSKEITPYFSQLALNGIEKYLKQWKRIWILVNKKGYAGGIICHDCGHIPKCKNCSVSISYHKLVSWETIGLCHICKTQYAVPATCPVCHSDKIKDFWLGTQKVAEYLKREYGKDALIIESETVNSPNKIAKIFWKIWQATEKSDKDSQNDFSDLSDNSSDSSVQIIIGTSLLATPIKNYPFDLVIFLNADLGLNIPDYTSAERNFYFLYEAFVKHSTTSFIVQSFNPDQYSIRTACQLNKEKFYEQDNIFRKTNGYPPFGELCVILYKNEIEESLFTKVDTLHKDLLYLKEKYGLKDIEIYSTPPLIYKMFGKYRYNIILKWPNVRQFMDIVFTKLNLAKKGFKVDRMAESIV